MLLSHSTSRILLIGLLALFHQASHAALLNFKDVEIRQIIESVGELTGRNFLIDNRVRGKVTLISTTETPDEMAYDVMLSVLRMYGFRAVEGPGGITRIIPANIAPRYSPLNQSEGLITKIIKIKHLNASTVLGIIRPLMTSQANVMVHKESNSLIIIESRSNIERVEDIIANFDKKSVGSYEIIDLQYLKAKDVAGILGRARNKQIKHLVDVVADNKYERIILTGEPRFRLPIRALIAELDRAPKLHKGQEGLVQIVHLNYANAEEMEKVLKGLLTKQFLDLTEGGSTIVGAAPAPAPKKAPPKKGDAKAADDKKSVVTATSDKRYTLQADPATNSLIIGGAAAVVNSILEVIRELDVPRAQVLIEAIIVEMTLGKAANLQTRLVGSKLARGDDGTRNRVPFSGGAPTGITSLEGLFAAFDSLAAEPIGQYFVGGRFNSGKLSLGILVDAIRTNNIANILSTPSVLTLNNEEASLTVGETRWYQTQKVDNAGNSQAEPKSQKVDLTFKVTPQITKGGLVRLKIDQKTTRVNEAIPRDQRIGGVPTLDRKIETNVVVRDGDVVVLGGMTQDERADSKSEIPLLSDIPILGHLFRGRDSRGNKLNLMVFVRPTIFRKSQDATDESEARYAALRLEQLQKINEVDSLLDEGTATEFLLPSLQRSEKPKLKRKSKKRKTKKRPVKKLSSRSDT